VPVTAADALSRETPLPLAFDQDSTQVMRRLEVFRIEFFAWVRTLASAAVYATLIVTFGFQVARVEGLSMAPTLADQDRLVVNKLQYRLTSPQRGDIVMLYYPVDPNKSFVKRVIAEDGDTVRVVDGRSTSTTCRCATTSCRRSTAATTTGARKSFPKAITS